MRRLLLILLVTSCMVTTVHPVLPSRMPLVVLAPHAVQDAQAYADLSAAFHAEWLACVGSYHTVTSADWKRIVIDSLVDSPTVWWSNSLEIDDASPPCGHAPTMHSHVVDNGYLETPSETDRASLRTRGTPFDALLSVHADSTWSFHLYYP